MAQVTPPLKTRKLSISGSHERPDDDMDEDPALQTPVPRRNESQLSSSDSGKPDGHTVFTRKNISEIVPATPDSTLDSIDGSQLRTPFNNFVSWAGSSPDIAGTPTPMGPLSNRSQLEFPVGKGIRLTPHMPTSLSALAGLRYGSESPLGTKARKRIQVSTSPKSPTEVEMPVLVPELTMKSSSSPPADDGEPQETAMQEVVDTISPTEDHTTSPMASPLEVDSTIQSPHSSTDAVIKKYRSDALQRWLDEPISRHPRILQQSPGRKDKILKRLRAFQVQSSRGTPLKPHNREHLGRVLQPESLDSLDQVYAIPDWPEDDQIPSIIPAEEMRRRQADLRLVEQYLEESTDSEEGEEELLSTEDPANAVVALRAKKSSRDWQQRRVAQAQSSRAATPKTKPSTRKSRQKTSSDDTRKETTVEPQQEMEVDKTDDADSADNDEVACICKGEDTGSPMVQCDNCHTWHHVECVTKPGDELPDKWFCWKCPMSAAPERASNMQEHTPTLVPTSNDYTAESRLSAAANITVYQGSSTPQDSPGLLSSDAKKKPSFDGFRTPPSSGRSRHLYGFWGDGLGDFMRHDDDPMTAIAATPFGLPFFPSPYLPFADMGPRGSPYRSPGKYASPAQPTPPPPKKEKPWTNYTGTYVAPNSNTNTFNPFTAPTANITTDPLFIHYEHDAPKQTAHHNSKSARPKRKAKGDKEMSKGESSTNGDDISAPVSAQSEHPSSGPLAPDTATSEEEIAPIQKDGLVSDSIDAAT